MHCDFNAKFLLLFFSNISFFTENQKPTGASISNNVNGLFTASVTVTSSSAVSVADALPIVTVATQPATQSVVTVNAGTSLQTLGLQIEPADNFMDQSDIRMLEDYLQPTLQEEFNTFKNEIRQDMEKWKESIVKSVREAIVNEFAKSTVISNMMPRQSFLPMASESTQGGEVDDDTQTAEGGLLSRLTTKIADVDRVNQLEVDLNDAKIVTCYVRYILPIYNRFCYLPIYNRL